MSQLAKNVIAEAKHYKKDYVDLGNCGLKGELPDELFDDYFIENLKWLSLGDRFIRGIKVVILKPVIGLGAQMVRSTNKGDNNIFTGKEACLARLKEFKKLKVLYISYFNRKGELIDASFLQNCLQIEHLGLWGNQITDLSTLPQLPNLKFLSLAYNKIKSIKDFPLFPQLTILDIGQNEIEVIESSENLQQVTQLDLSDNKISRLENLGQFIRLQNLRLKGNKLSTIENIDGQPYLQSLNLSWNKITDISPILRLMDLRTLYLHFNEITNLSPLSGLGNLTVLDLSSNQITDLSPLSGLGNLTELNLHNNDIADLSPLSGLGRLKNLDLSSNQITNLTPLPRLENLTVLQLWKNQITDLLPLSKLGNLTELRLWQNQITDLSPLSGLKNLTVLDLSSNQITDLSPLSGLGNLTELNLGGNKITDLSPLSGLRSLTMLTLYSNQIINLSPLSGLVNLRQLFLSENKITDLTPLLPHYKRGIHISVEGNPLQTPPMEIEKQGNDAILSFLIDYTKGNVTNKELKMIVVGNGCVGKTALVRRLCHNEYEEIDLETGRTHGIVIEHYSLPDSEVQLHIWDFGGQEIYHATHRLFLSDQTLYLLLWTKEAQDHPNEPHFPPTYWLDYIAKLSQGKTSRVLLVPTKTDLYGNYTLNDFNALQIEYRKQNLKLYTIPAVSTKDNTNMRTLKAQLTELAEQMIAEYHSRLPNNWIAARQKVYEQWIDKVNTTTLQDFADLCSDLDIDNKTVLLSYLSSMGIVFWQKAYLRNDIIVNQQYFLDIIYALLQNRHVKKDGIFTWEDACDVWQTDRQQKPLTDDDRRLFLRFMRGCEIMFETKDKDGKTQYIVPQLLPEKPYTWQNRNATYFLRLTYPFLHRNIIGRFIVRTAYLADKHHSWWRNGIYLLDKQDNEAHIESLATSKMDYRNQSILVRVAGASAISLLVKVRNEFAKLSRFDMVEQHISLDSKAWISRQEWENAERHRYKNLRDTENKEHTTADYVLFRDLFSSKNKEDMEIGLSERGKRVFISYAKEDLEHLQTLKKHLSPLVRNNDIEEPWHDREIQAGTDWDSAIQTKLNTADVVLVLISADYFSTQKNYIWEKEMPTIIERHNNKQVLAIPIIVRACMWQKDKWISQLQAVTAINPTDNSRIPLLSAANQDEAFASAAEQIYDAIEAYRTKR